MLLSEKPKLNAYLEHEAEQHFSVLNNYSLQEIKDSFNLSPADDKAKQLLDMYKEILLRCRTDYQSYLKRRLEDHQAIIKFIDENDVRREWAYLHYFLVINGDTADKVNPVLVTLASEVADTWMLMTYSSPNYVCGVTKDGDRFLETRDPYFGWSDELDSATFATMTSKGKKRLESAVNKLGGPVGILRYQERDRALTRLLLNSIWYINEDTKALIPERWVDHTSYNFAGARGYLDGDKLNALVHNPKKPLPRGGVTCKLKNSYDVSEVFLLEDTTSLGEHFIGFRVTNMQGEGTFGIFCPENLGVSLGYRSTDPSTDNILALVFELYADLTSGFEKNVLRKYALLEVDDLDDPKLNSTNLYVKYEPVASTQKEINVKDLLTRRFVTPYRFLD